MQQVRVQRIRIKYVIIQSGEKLHLEFLGHTAEEHTKQGPTTAAGSAA